MPQPTSFSNIHEPARSNGSAKDIDAAVNGLPLGSQRCVLGRPGIRNRVRQRVPEFAAGYARHRPIHIVPCLEYEVS